MNNIGQYADKAQKYYKSAKPIIDQLQTMMLNRK